MTVTARVKRLQAIHPDLSEDILSDYVRRSFIDSISDQQFFNEAEYHIEFDQENPGILKEWEAAGRPEDWHARQAKIPGSRAQQNIINFFGVRGGQRVMEILGCGASDGSGGLTG